MCLSGAAAAGGKVEDPQEQLKGRSSRQGLLRDSIKGRSNRGAAGA